jgi:hypothetical protein
MTYKTPSYDTKNALKVIFDKTSFIKFKISNNFKQDIDGTVLNHLQQNPYQSMNLKKLKKRNPGTKSLKTFAYGFLSFLISISGE